MRPLRLTIRGLRSYRHECTIDFRDRGLIAIVGDTGAGKSSILEALTYALYNATTWDQRSVGQLIADGVPSMSVELEFQARDQVWQVHRACHRTAGRPSTHRLRCLSDAAAEEHDGEAAVSRQVERLLGMNYRAYRAAVVLPQGRFQTLLHETRANRTEILEGIFRLTDLRTVRTTAQELGRRAEAAVGGLTARREALLPDPAATAKAVAVELDARRMRESLLSGLHADVLATREAGRAATRRVEALRGHARLVTRPEGGVAKSLADLVPLAAAIEAELSETAAREGRARRQEEVAAAAGAAAAERRERVEDLAAAAELLAAARQTLVDVEAAESLVEHDQAEVDAGAIELATAEATLPDLEAASEAAGQVAASASAALEKHREFRRQVTEALRLAREAAGAFDAAAVEERRRQETLPALQEALAGMRSRVFEGERTLEARRTELDEAQRRDSAAHAALGLHAGDPCPVCGRPLQETFEPPSAGALQPLRRAVKEAESELTRLRSAETTAVNQVDEAERRLVEAVSRRKAAESAAVQRLASLRFVLPGADLDVDDAAISGPIDEHERDLAATAATSAQEAQQARDRLGGARADVEARRSGQHGRVARLDRERARVQGLRDRCRAQLATLPEALAAGEVVHAVDLDPVIAAAEGRLDAAREERRALDALRAEVARLAQAGAGLRRRLQDDVGVPRGLAMRGAGELLLRVNDGLAALDRPRLDGAPSGATIDAELRWSEELDRRVEELRQWLTEEIAGVDRATAAAGAGLLRRLEEHGIADDGALDDEVRNVGRQVGRLQGELDAAQAQIRPSADLDRRIATGTEIRDSLSELARLLQDSQFVGHVIDRRQRQLLIVASQVLGSMTGGAYGFSPDFDIVDLRTRQPRPTRTLSGGETFLASLALALALVEIAGRSGTRLDALFLDEGFGSLDADALDEALSALERQAGEGRLVAIVSHVRAVAERIETVLEVIRSPLGSSAVWRGAAEPELMLADELEARLLA